MVLNEAGMTPLLQTSRLSHWTGQGLIYHLQLFRATAEVSLREPLGSGHGPRPTPVPGLIAQVADGKWSWAVACPVPSPPKETHSAILRAGRGQQGARAEERSCSWWAGSSFAAPRLLVFGGHIPLTPQWGGGSRQGSPGPALQPAESNDCSLAKAQWVVH